MNPFHGPGQGRQWLRDAAAQDDPVAMRFSTVADQATVEDERIMARALKLADKGRYTTHPNPVVGCVIVKDGNVIGEGWHQYAGGDHAEIVALKQAGKAARGATLYVTLEPCSQYGRTPPCVKAIKKAGIVRVVVATEDPDLPPEQSGIAELRHSGIHVLTGVGRSRAKQQNRGFLKRVTTGMPWVTLKIAASLDGKTAMSSGESQWITGPCARLDGQRARAASCAVLTGIGTVLRDNPAMNVRLKDVSRQPCRIVLDTNLSMPVNSKILALDGQVLIMTTSREREIIEAFSGSGAEIIECARNPHHPEHGGIDLEWVMRELGKRKMNTVLLEAGARLSGSMMKQGLVDEVIVYMSPDLLGAKARDMFVIAGLDQLADRMRLEYREVVMIGRDLKITLDALAGKSPRIPIA